MWLQPHYNLVEREGYERDYAPIVAEHGLAVAPYYALASGFLTGKYRRRRRRRLAARRAARALPRRARPSACSAALDEIAGAHDVPMAAVAIAWLLGASRGVVGADRQRAHRRAARGAAPGVELQLTDDELAPLDEASA